MKDIRQTFWKSLILLYCSGSGLFAAPWGGSDGRSISVTTLLQNYRDISRIEVELAQAQMRLQQLKTEQIHKLHDQQYASWLELQDEKLQFAAANAKYLAAVDWERFVERQLQFAQDQPTQSIYSMSRVVFGIDSLVPLAWVTIPFYSTESSHSSHRAWLDAITHRIQTDELCLAELDKASGNDSGTTMERERLGLRVLANRIEKRLCTTYAQLPALEVDTQCFVDAWQLHRLEVRQVAEFPSLLLGFLQIIQSESRQKLRGLDHLEFEWLSARTNAILDLADRGFISARYASYHTRRTSAMHETHAASIRRFQGQLKWVNAKLDQVSSRIDEQQSNEFDLDSVLSGIEISKCENATAIVQALDWVRRAITIESQLRALDADRSTVAESLVRVRNQTDVNSAELGNIEQAEKALLLQRVQLQSQLDTLGQLLAYWPTWSVEIAETRLELLDQSKLDMLGRHHFSQLVDLDTQWQMETAYLKKRLVALEQLRLDGFASELEVAEARQMLLNKTAELLPRKQSFTVDCETDGLLQTILRD